MKFFKHVDTSTVIGLSLALALTLCLSACFGGGSDRLERLRAAPMGIYELDMAERTEVHESPGSSGTIKDTPAEIRREFTVPADSVADAIREIADDAEAVGYILQPKPTIGYTGSGSFEDLQVTISIGANETDGRVWLELFLS